MKKVRTHVWGIFMAFVMLLTLLPTLALAAGEGLTAEDPLVVPEEGLAISGTTLYGIDAAWFTEAVGSEGHRYLSVKIPSSVTKIAFNGLTRSYTSDKAKYGALNSHNNPGQSYDLVALDLSQATNLTSIDKQAALNCSLLKGELDLSHTQLVTIGKSAFSGCAGLTGIILPDTLENLGSENAGSVFNGCSSLQYIRLDSSGEESVFELPSSLTYIGNQTFKNCFADGVEARIVIPASVKTIGSEAFYSSRIVQIVVERQGDGWESQYSGYNSSAFKTGNSNLLVIFKDNTSYQDYSLNCSPISAVKKAMAYPLTLKFGSTGIAQEKLNCQSIQYTRVEDTDFWEKDTTYTLPTLENTPAAKPGYDVNWILGGKPLTDTGTLDTNLSSPTATVSYALQNPTVQYAVDGVAQAGRDLTVHLDDQAHTAGVLVSHPLMLEAQGSEEGEYVYFEYCWWDEHENSVNGPRSEAEPELFSTAGEGGVLDRVKTEYSEIPIESKDHARTGSSQYMVEIYGYIVRNGAEPERFYKSHYNFIDFVVDGDTEATVDVSYVFQVAVEEPTAYSITYDLAGGTLSVPNPTEYTVYTPDFTLNNPIRSGYTFAGWTGTGLTEATETVTIAKGSTGERSYTATWTEDEVPGVAYSITASAGTGGSIDPEGSVWVGWGNDQTFTITADAGYGIFNVLIDGESVGIVSDYTFENVCGSHTIEAVFKADGAAADPDSTGVSDWLNAEDHMAYLAGYPGGSFGPDRNITRAEAAQLFYNLLLDKDISITAAFDDVGSNVWYSDAVNTLASLGILEGVGNNLYEPERTITRAEFTAMAMRFSDLKTGGENIFQDVNKDEWFYDAVVGSIQYGWINGYPDGTFRPYETITRAEVAVIANRMLGRSADVEYVSGHTDSLRQFSDLESSHWAYYDIMEAANGHRYQNEGNGIENWTGLD